MRRFLLRLPILALVLAGAMPTVRAEPAPKKAAAAFEASRDSARLEPTVPGLMLLGRAPESGGALRFVALVVSGQSIRPPAADRGAPALPSSALSGREALPALGRAPPAARS